MGEGGGEGASERDCKMRYTNAVSVLVVTEGEELTEEGTVKCGLDQAMTDGSGMRRQCNSD